MALADLEDAPVHLGPLKLEHPLASYGTLWGMVSRHYTRQVLQGVYKVRITPLKDQMLFISILHFG
jgi:hypothetical protein